MAHNHIFELLKMLQLYHSHDYLIGQKLIQSQALRYKFILNICSLHFLKYFKYECDCLNKKGYPTYLS